jgi:Zn-finger nucleic acid-binding protein
MIEIGWIVKWAVATSSAMGDRIVRATGDCSKQQWAKREIGSDGCSNCRMGWLQRGDCNKQQSTTMELWNGCVKIITSKRSSRFGYERDVSKNRGVPNTLYVFYLMFGTYARITRNFMSRENLHCSIRHNLLLHSTKHMIRLNGSIMVPYKASRDVANLWTTFFFLLVEGSIIYLQLHGEPIVHLVSLEFRSTISTRMLTNKTVFYKLTYHCLDQKSTYNSISVSNIQIQNNSKLGRCVPLCDRIYHSKLVHREENICKVNSGDHITLFCSYSKSSSI